MSATKIAFYLFDPASDDGASKGRYLTSYGFAPSEPERLRAALLDHARMPNFVGVRAAAFGLKFLFDGPLPAPNGRDATVLTVWQVDAFGDGVARFVTTRPSGKRR